MTDLMIRIGVSNLTVSVALALLAWVVQARLKQPRVAYLFWLLLLVKLVTPPIVTVPMLAVPGDAAVAASPTFAVPPPTAVDLPASAGASDVGPIATDTSPVRPAAGSSLFGPTGLVGDHPACLAGVPSGSTSTGQVSST